MPPVPLRSAPERAVAVRRVLACEPALESRACADCGGPARTWCCDDCIAKQQAAQRELHRRMRAEGNGHLISSGPSGLCDPDDDGADTYREMQRDSGERDGRGRKP